MFDQIMSRSSTAILSIALIATAGCANLGLKKPSLPSAPMASKAKPEKPDELPTSQTVQLCLTTAGELVQQGHLTEAIQLYQKARSLDPTAVDYSRILAALYDGQGEYSKATDEYRLAIEKHPSDANLLNDFGCLHKRHGNFVEAELHLRKAVALDGTNNRSKTNLAIALAQQMRYQEAFDLFAAVSGPAAAHSNIGMIKARQGKSEEAKTALRTALSMNANNPQAHAMLSYLETPRLNTVAGSAN